MAARNKPRVHVVAEFAENGRVAVIRMQCADNRINPEFISDFNNALDEVESTPTVQIMITTGEGNFYSNGLDLETLPNLSKNQLVQFGSDLHKLTVRLLAFPMLTIAAINGHCYAMGALLALAHDYRVMRNDRGWFCLPEIFLRASFPMILMQLASTKIPTKEHVHCILLGKKYTGEEALNAGIVHRISSNPQLMSTTLSLAKEVTSHVKEELDRDTLSRLKQDLYANICKCPNEPPVLPKL